MCQGARDFQRAWVVMGPYIAFAGGRRGHMTKAQFTATICSAAAEAVRTVTFKIRRVVLRPLTGGRMHGLQKGRRSTPREQ